MFYVGCLCCAETVDGGGERGGLSAVCARPQGHRHRGHDRTQDGAGN